MNVHSQFGFRIAILGALLLLLIGHWNAAFTADLETKPVQIREKIEDPVLKSPPAPGPLNEVGTATPEKKVRPAAAVSATGSQKTLMEASTPISTGSPRYSASGKIDPFEPFMKKKVAPKKKKKKKRVPRGPLERIDLSQLKLTAVIATDRGNLAMVEETSGKGYVINTGTYIGTNAGRVIKILKNRVVVEEQVEGLDGEMEIKKQELKLQRFSGEEHYE